MAKHKRKHHDGSQHALSSTPAMNNGAEVEWRNIQLDFGDVASYTENGYGFLVSLFHPSRERRKDGSVFFHISLVRSAEARQTLDASRGQKDIDLFFWYVASEKDGKGWRADNLWSTLQEVPDGAVAASMDKLIELASRGSFPRHWIKALCTQLFADTRISDLQLGALLKASYFKDSPDEVVAFLRASQYETYAQELGLWNKWLNILDELPRWAEQVTERLWDADRLKFLKRERQALKDRAEEERRAAVEKHRLKQEAADKAQQEARDQRQKEREKEDQDISERLKGTDVSFRRDEWGRILYYRHYGSWLSYEDVAKALAHKSALQMRSKVRSEEPIDTFTDNATGSQPSERTPQATSPVSKSFKRTTGFGRSTKFVGMGPQPLRPAPPSNKPGLEIRPGIPVPFKSDWREFEKIVKANGITSLYHFTDETNLASIHTHGGLYSWWYCTQHGIKIARPGGDPKSRELDLRKGLEDYVRLAFNSRPPMLFNAKDDGRIKHEIILEIDVSVIYWEATQFSDINAADGAACWGPTLEDFQMVKLGVAKSLYWHSTQEFAWRQAEALVETHIPLQYVTNWDHVWTNQTVRAPF